MKVMVVASYAPSLLNFRRELLEKFQSLGWEVHVAAPELLNDSDKNSFEGTGWICHGFNMDRKKMNPFRDLRSFFQLILIFLKVRPHLLLSYTIKPVIYGSIAGFLTRIPKRHALITGLGYAFQEESSKLYKLVCLLYRISVHCVDKVFFQNPDDQFLFRKKGILSAIKPSYVVNGSGVNLKHFNVVDLPEKPAFLLIARLLKAKGLREYAEAARLLKDQLGEWKIYLLGPEDASSDSIDLAEVLEWQREGIVEYLGSTEDVRKYFAMASVYVLPSYREGTPRTVLEAMAMGRPIITTDVPGCRETVITNLNGFLVPHRDPHELANAMLRFIENPSLINLMGKQSRVIADTKYDVEKINAYMIEEMGAL